MVILLLFGCSNGSSNEAQVDEIVAFVSGDWGELRDAWEVIHNEQVALCMKEQGFEMPLAQTRNKPGEDATEPRQEFGWVESLRDSVSSDGNGPTITTPISLSEAERAAFESALWGAEDPREREDVGCFGESRVIADELSGVADLQVFREPVTNEIEIARNSPEYAALDAEWRKCMASAGFAVDDIPGMHDIVRERWEATSQDDTAALELERLLFATHERCSEERRLWFDEVLRDAVSELVAAE